MPCLWGRKMIRGENRFEMQMTSQSLQVIHLNNVNLSQGPSYRHTRWRSTCFMSESSQPSCWLNFANAWDKRREWWRGRERWRTEKNGVRGSCETSLVRGNREWVIICDSIESQRRHINSSVAFWQYEQVKKKKTVMERERDLGKENRSEHHVDVIYFYAKMYFEKQ